MFYFILLIIVVVIFFAILTNLKLQNVVKEPLPYQAKKFFFTRSEQQFFRILHETINHERFTVFTKVRLADLVEVHASKEQYQKWWNKIRSKHVDFLIWDTTNSKIVLAIEVDGKSHTSQKMIASDTFKDELYSTIGIPLHRIQVGSDFKTEVEKLFQTLS